MRARSTSFPRPSSSSTGRSGSCSTTRPIASSGRSTRPGSTRSPRDSEILDRLRAARLLPEQADFRAWKAALLDAYQSLETEEQVWYLPDGRTLRVVFNPNPQGGVTYIFDDVTERFHLRVAISTRSIRVQSETLDTLQEGVAVFGSDGRLKLYNPAFAGIWALRWPEH